MRNAGTQAGEKSGWGEEDRYAARDMGYTLLSEGKYSLAEAIFAGLVEVDPGDAYARLALGVAYRRLGKETAAVREFEEALRIDPRLWNAAVHLAEIHIQRKEAEAAKRYAAVAGNLARTRSCPAAARKRIGRIGRLAAALTKE